MTVENRWLDYRWNGIEEISLTLRGLDTGFDSAISAVTLVSRWVLATSDSIHDPAAIAFDVTVSLPNRFCKETLEHKSHHALYGSLQEVRDQLKALREGVTQEARILMEGFTLRIFQHANGPKSGFCVEGEISSILDSHQSPWPNDGIGNWLLSHPSAYLFRFTFRTSLVDPPLIDNFSHDINRLLAHLELWAPGSTEQGS